MGVCVEMTRGVESQISRDDVKRVIEEVMDGGSKAVAMRKRAVAVGELIRAALTEEDGRKGSSLKALDDFVDTLLSLRPSA